MTKSMIFHHPLPVNPGGNSGSQVRPYQMAKAFENIGYEVEMVTGYGADRKKAIKKIKNEAKKGRKFDFIYSESSTMPTLLTEPHHLPIYPVLDFGFFHWAKKNGIPIGLFYRDVYWKFDMYKKELSRWKSLISIPLFWYDWVAYRNLIDHLYLPSLLMKNALPTSWSEDTLSSLPPGGENKELNFNKPSSKKLNLIYIGGMKPPGYNLSPMFNMVGQVKGNNINLKLCCRKEEWQSVEWFYKSLLSSNIEIIHWSGSKLKELYMETDLFLLIRENHEYLDFAMPVKVLEALGHGVPILTLSGTEAARFIHEEDIGWVVDSIEEAKELLFYFIKNPKVIEDKRKKVIEAQVRHTWEARALMVVETLKKEN